MQVKLYTYKLVLFLYETNYSVDWAVIYLSDSVSTPKQLRPVGS